jgi:hypothetical protein
MRLRFRRRYVITPLAFTDPLQHGADLFGRACRRLHVGFVAWPWDALRTVLLGTATALPVRAREMVGDDREEMV